MSRRTQRDMLLDHLRINGVRGVTDMDAFGWGCRRLSARIWDLRQEGFHIDKEWMTTAGGARVARYVLREEQMTLRFGVAS